MRLINKQMVFKASRLWAHLDNESWINKKQSSDLMALWNQPRRLKEVAIRQGSQEPSVLKPNWRNFKKKRVINYVKNATVTSSWKEMTIFCTLEVTIAYDSYFSELIGAKAWLKWVQQSSKGKFLMINTYVIFEKLLKESGWLQK